MGEGHNTAARNIQQALQAEAGSGVEVLVVDPYTRTNPVVNRCIQKGYAAAINNYPRLWKMVFAMLSQPKAMESMAPLLLQLTNAVHSFGEGVSARSHRFHLSGFRLHHATHPALGCKSHDAALHGDHRFHDDQPDLVSLPLRRGDCGRRSYGRGFAARWRDC
jgi:hypothetical protein